MKLAIVVQARLSSQRLPGKVLKEVNGKPLLQYTLDRLSQSIHLPKVIVATSQEKSDDPIVAYCTENNLNVFRGSLTNVAQRYADLVKKYNLSAFVRVTGDSPLIDTQLIDAGIESYQTGQFDLVTNVCPRSFPKGQSFEVINAKVFLEAVSQMNAPEEQEHITQYFYRRVDDYRIYNIESDLGNHAEENVSIDTEEDFVRFQTIMANSDRPVIDLGWEEILQLHKEYDAHECRN